ncbi:hypothetical protein ACSSS7_006757 [Eimeria intestinalis]
MARDKRNQASAADRLSALQYAARAAITFDTSARTYPGKGEQRPQDANTLTAEDDSYAAPDAPASATSTGDQRPSQQRSATSSSAPSAPCADTSRDTHHGAGNPASSSMQQRRRPLLHSRARSLRPSAPAFPVATTLAVTGNVPHMPMNASAIQPFLPSAQAALRTASARPRAAAANTSSPAPALITSKLVATAAAIVSATTCQAQPDFTAASFAQSWRASARPPPLWPHETPSTFPIELHPPSHTYTPWTDGRILGVNNHDPCILCCSPSKCVSAPSRQPRLSWWFLVFRSLLCLMLTSSTSTRSLSASASTPSSSRATRIGYPLIGHHPRLVLCLHGGPGHRGPGRVYLNVRMHSPPHTRARTEREAALPTPATGVAPQSPVQPEPDSPKGAFPSSVGTTPKVRERQRAEPVEARAPGLVIGKFKASDLKDIWNAKKRLAKPKTQDALSHKETIYLHKRLKAFKGVRNEAWKVADEGAAGGFSLRREYLGYIWPSSFAKLEKQWDSIYIAEFPEVTSTPG